MTGDLLDTILAEVAGVVARTDRAPLGALARALDAAGPVFVTGEGRSGFMGQAVALRLMHRGLPGHGVGETTTPAVGADATVVAVSGSGTTTGTVHVARSAADRGAAVWAVTTDADSPLAAIAAGTPGGVVVVPAATKHRRAAEAATIQPLSSLFDQGVHLVLDAVCLELAGLRQVDNATAVKAHANTE